MTIAVVDLARAGGLAFGKYNTTYQKGNDNANTPDATWLDMFTVTAGTAETHVTSRGEVVPWAAVDNSLDAWVPFVVLTTLDKTANTWRP